MGSCPFDYYTLPTVEFVGGETQELVFHVYHYIGKRPHSLVGCTANFSVVSFINKTGAPIISKQMEVRPVAEGEVDNILTVTIDPKETVGMSGKYIYQITIKDISGDVEVPKQGIFLVVNNINKGFI